MQEKNSLLTVHNWAKESIYFHVVAPQLSTSSVEVPSKSTWSDNILANNYIEIEFCKMEPDSIKKPVNLHRVAVYSEVGDIGKVEIGEVVNQAGIVRTMRITCTNLSGRVDPPDNVEVGVKE